MARKVVVTLTAVLSLVLAGWSVDAMAQPPPGGFCPPLPPGAPAPPLPPGHPCAATNEDATNEDATNEDTAPAPAAGGAPAAASPPATTGSSPSTATAPSPPAAAPVSGALGFQMDVAGAATVPATPAAPADAPPVVHAVDVAVSEQALANTGDATTVLGNLGLVMLATGAAMTALSLRRARGCQG